MPTDLEIARASTPRPITDVAAELGLAPPEIVSYGHDVAKISPSVLTRPRQRAGEGNLVLVSAITPTPAGEGKTTTSIGLAQALARLGHSSCLALRQPSRMPASPLLAARNPSRTRRRGEPQPSGVTPRPGRGCASWARQRSESIHATGCFSSSGAVRSQWRAAAASDFSMIDLASSGSPRSIAPMAFS